MPRRFAAVLTLVMTSLSLTPARGVEVTTRGIHDTANFFSAEAEQRAGAMIDKIHNARGKDVLIETFETLPVGKQLPEFARERATAAKLSGIYVVIVRKGGQVGVLPDTATTAMFPHDVATQLREQLVADLRKSTKNFDTALINGVEFIAGRLGGNGAAGGRPATGAATRPAGRAPAVVLTPPEPWDAARDARARVRLVLEPSSKVRGTFSAVQKLKVDDLDTEMERKFKEAGAEAGLSPAQLDAKRDEMVVAAAKTLDGILNEEQRAAVELDVRAMKRRDAAAAHAIECAARAKKILAACVAYAADHEFAFPSDLGTLVAERGVDVETFVCPATETPVPAAVRDGSKEAKAAWVNQHADYVYLGKGQRTSVAAGFVLLHEKAGDHKAVGEGADEVPAGITIGYGDGEVDFVRDADARSILEALGKGKNPPR